jgi:hypothetical protein
MMSGKDGVGQIIKACVTVATRIALTCRFRVIKTTLDDLCGLTRGAGNAVWPASFADCLIILNLIDQIRDVDLHRWTPVRGWDMGGYQYTTSSHSTTLESNKSVASLDSSPRGSMMVTGTDLIVPDHSRSAQGRVHFINAFLLTP